MEDTIYYFGYGANRDPDMMAAITGAGELVGIPAVLNGFDLVVQRINQVPEPAQKILRKEWGDDFVSYSIRPEPGGRVRGVIWTLTPQERDLVADWELVGDWYRGIVTEAHISGGKTIRVITESLGFGQDFDHTVNGQDCETFLNRKEKMLEVAIKSRREYYERQQTKEGSAISPELKSS